LLAGEEFRCWRLDGGRARRLCRLCEPAAAEYGWSPEGTAYERERVLGLASTVRLVDAPAARVAPAVLARSGDH